MRASVFGASCSDTNGMSIDDCTLCPEDSASAVVGSVSSYDCQPCVPPETAPPGSALCSPGLVNVSANNPEPVVPGISDGDTLTVRLLVSAGVWVGRVWR